MSVWNPETGHWDPLAWGVSDSATAIHHKLTLGELEMARIITAQNAEESESNGCRDKFAAADATPEERHTRNLVGWAGEIAASTVLDVEWPGGLTGPGYDLPPDIAVRTRDAVAAAPWEPDLCFRPRDDVALRYLHVVARLPHVWLTGWLYGHECQGLGTEGHSGGRLVWYVRQDKLRRMDTWVT